MRARLRVYPKSGVPSLYYKFYNCIELRMDIITYTHMSLPK
jgi:hypothetical protein